MEVLVLFSALGCPIIFMWIPLGKEWDYYFFFTGHKFLRNIETELRNIDANILILAVKLEN